MMQVPKAILRISKYKPLNSLKLTTLTYSTRKHMWGAMHEAYSCISSRCSLKRSDLGHTDVVQTDLIYKPSLSSHETMDSVVCWCKEKVVIRYTMGMAVSANTQTLSVTTAHLKDKVTLLNMFINIDGVKYIHSPQVISDTYTVSKNDISIYNAFITVSCNFRVSNEYIFSEPTLYPGIDVDFKMQDMWTKGMEYVLTQKGVKDVSLICNSACKDHIHPMCGDILKSNSDILGNKLVGRIRNTLDISSNSVNVIHGFMNYVHSGVIKCTQVSDVTELANVFQTQRLYGGMVSVNVWWASHRHRELCDRVLVKDYYIFEGPDLSLMYNISKMSNMKAFDTVLHSIESFPVRR